MGASYRSDSVHFLIFPSGHHSNPVRILWGCLLMAICILQRYLPWHLDGAKEVWVLFLFEPLIWCDLEHVLHHLTHCWSQHSDQRNRTSAHQVEQKMPSIKRIHCTNRTVSNLPLSADLWPMPPSVSSVHSLSLAPPFVTVGVISWLHKAVSCRLQRWFCVSPGNVLYGTGHTPEALCSPFHRLWALGQGSPPCVFV